MRRRAGGISCARVMTKSTSTPKVKRSKAAPGAAAAVPAVAAVAAPTTDDLVRARKVGLRTALVNALQSAVDTARAAYLAAVEGATHAEAKAENSKDTRGLEQSYVARGQAQRVAELETGLTAVSTMTIEPQALDSNGAPSPVRIGSIVVVRDQADDRCATYWIAPAGGGTVLVAPLQTSNGDTAAPVTVVTPSSPLGRALLTRLLDDEIVVGEGAKQRTFDIVAIA